MVQDAATGEVLTLAYINEEALRAHARDRRDALLEPLPRRALAQGRDLGQRPARARAALRLRRRRGPRARRSRRARLPHGRAHLLLPRAATAPSPTPVTHEALPALERTLAARRAERPEGSYTAELLADPELIGAKVREEADEVARAVAGESDERVAEEAADVLYHLEVALLSRDVPLGRALDVLLERRPSATDRPRSVDLTTSSERASSRHAATSSRSSTRFVEDTETPVSAFLKLRGDGPCVPARVGRAGRPPRALLVPRLQPAAAVRWVDGELLEWERRGGDEPPAEPSRRDPGARSLRRRRRATLERFELAGGEDAAVPGRRPSACSATTSSAPSSRSASRTPTRSACPTWR